MNRAFRWKPSLLTSFSILGAIITGAIAVVVALNLEQQLEQNALRLTAESASDQVIRILGPNLRLTDLSAPLDGARYEQIDALIHEHILHGHIVRVKIWNFEGLVIYSDERSLVGRYFPVTDELNEALSGTTSMEISDLTAEENVAERGLYPRLLEVYVPIRLPISDQVVGVYEIYHDLLIVEPAIAAMQRFVWISVGAGFLVLYGSLFTLVRNASRELNRRNEENKSLYEQEQTRRAELAALYDLSRGLADVHDYSTALSLIARHTVEKVHVTFSRIALLEGDELVIRAAHPIRVLNQSLHEGERYRLGSSQFIQRTLKQNAPILISDDSPELSNAERKALFLGIARTICLIPLHVSGRDLGLLMFGEARSQEREPFSPDKLKLIYNFGDQVSSALYRIELFVRLEKSYLETVLALANAVNAKDTYTADHSQNLAEMALSIGREMGMAEDELEDLRYGAILHDIGKIGIPDAVLKKPSRLDHGEWAQMRQHPAIGAEILYPVPRLSGAAQIVRHHHERYDGEGYPDGLFGESIPLGARILTVVDSYNAMTEERTYKEARSHAEAMSELSKHAGAQFDPRIVEIFLALFSIQERRL